MPATGGNLLCPCLMKFNQYLYICPLLGLPASLEEKEAIAELQFSPRVNKIVLKETQRTGKQSILHSDLEDLITRPETVMTLDGMRRGPARRAVNLTQDSELTGLWLVPSLLDRRRSIAEPSWGREMAGGAPRRPRHLPLVPLRTAVKGWSRTRPQGYQTDESKKGKARQRGFIGAEQSVL